MKNKNFLLAVLIGLAGLFANSSIFGQEEEKASPFSVGADVYSNYIWRGTKFGTGPAFQPGIKFTTGGLTIGAWGSFDAAGYQEADLYFSYSLPFGLSFGLTDYYYPGLKYFTFSGDTASHAFEINLGYTIKGLTLSGNYILNQSNNGGAGSVGDDMYFQATYAFKNFNIFVGAGDGWHTSDAEFAVCNLGIGTSKTIKITDSFSIPVTGQVVLNPEKEQLYMVVGFSL
jgi:hypothetical protein